MPATVKPDFIPRGRMGVKIARGVPGAGRVGSRRRIPSALKSAALPETILTRGYDVNLTEEGVARSASTLVRFAALVVLWMYDHWITPGAIAAWGACTFRDLPGRIGPRVLRWMFAIRVPGLP
jgi:hypothetical protein